MIDFFVTNGAWLVTGLLLTAGLIGCVLPVLPGHLLIFIGAIGYRWMLGEDAGLAWWSFLILLLIMAVSQIFEHLSGSVGAKRFGGSKWAALGAFVGCVLGLFFLPFGLFVGPLVGAFVFEIAFTKKNPHDSAVAGMGAVVGVVAGMAFSLLAGALMIAWFFTDVFLIQ